MAARLPLNATRYNPSEVAVKDATGSLARALLRPDGLELYVRDFAVRSGTQAVALIVLVHGFSFHSKYFKPVAEHLIGEGIVTVTYDLRGHGLSGKVDGIPGFVHSFDEHVDDLLAVLKFARDRHVGLPCFVLGESMGGSIIASLMRERRLDPAVQTVQGLVFTSPVFRIAPHLLPPPPVLAVLRLLRVLFPKLPLKNEVANTFEDAFGDKDVAKQARQDSLVVFDAPRLCFGLSAVDALQRCLPHMKELQKSWLLIHGGLDTRTSPSNSQELYDHSVSKDKTLKIYEDANHQVFQDVDDIPERAMSDITSWVKDRAWQTESTT